MELSFMSSTIKRILSIDWDYFYPDPTWYDMGANENKSIFMDLVWHTRCSMTNKDGISILDHFKPEVPADFWNIVKNKPNIYLYDSHFNIWNHLKDGKYDVTSIDAHHDCGYHEDIGDYIDASNWALFGKILGHINNYELIYPQWRKNCEENFFHTEYIDKILYKLPRSRNYDMIFICRSGCWTPPWYDDKLSVFVNTPTLSITDRIEYRRNLTLDAVKCLKMQMDEQIESLKKM